MITDAAAVLPDILELRLRVVFCGMAAGIRSAQMRAYYAGQGNRFWEIVERVGLTPERLAPHEYTRLPEYGIGLTDLAKFASGPDSRIPSEAFDRSLFARKIHTFAPRVLAFNGKKAAELFLNRPVDYGRQNDTIGSTKIFVLPSTSAAARGYWDEKHWRDLAALVLDT